ncbi:MAG: hypothetical protein AAF916_11085 [Planctomycetota bacterium]
MAVLATSACPPEVHAPDTSADSPRFRGLAWGAVFVSAAGLLLAGFLSFDTWKAWVHDETGVMELLTVGYALPASGLFAWLAWRGRRLPRLARGWFAVMALASFYFAGEEASWGQHVLGFEPPAFIADSNLQGEFNFHNADAWYHDILNEWPRTAATACCLVGAGVLPFVVADRRKLKGAADRAWYWIVPTTTLVLPGLVAFTWNLPEKFLEDTYEGTQGWVDLAWVAAADETKEYFIALAILIYAGSVFWRNTRLERAHSDTPEVDARQQ